nr:Multidrug/solvent efflux pump outer membrane protein MepC [Paraburkholderia busanensis]
MTTWRSLTLPGLFALLAAGGCSLAPTYEKPAVALPAAFKEGAGGPGAAGAANATSATSATSAADAASGAAARNGQWKVAEPAEAQARGAWWRVFGDPVLNAFEDDAVAANPGLQVAAARVKESRAIQQASRAGLFPTLDAGFGPSRQKFSPASQFLPDNANGPLQTFWRAQAGVSYEADLFGRVSDEVKASTADAEQSEATFRSVMLALQSDVARSYFTVRELDAELAVLSRSVALRDDALRLVQHRFELGEVSELDLAQSRAELASARSDLLTLTRLRAAAEHSLAVLLGKTPAEFSFAASPLEPVSVEIPAGLPSALLERRPDIAAAERTVAAANARIGVAKAAFFPSLSLTGVGGFESASLGDLMKWSSRAFLLGPLAGTALTLPLFDGGRRSGNLANARAVHEESVANYRQQVLTAFREVEDNLAALRILKDQRVTQGIAVSASNRASQLSVKQYREGAVSYLEVIDAERSALQARRADAQLAGVQALSTVNLIQALGGGWEETVAAR